MTSAKEELADLGVLQTGHFRLSSGKHTDTYLQWALALADPAVALSLGRALGAKALDKALGVSPIDVVASPALGGVLAGFAVAAALQRRFVFAERGADRSFTLRRGQAVSPGERVLVVEDAVTTGGSALEVARLLESSGATVAAIACLVDRSGGLPANQRPNPPPISLYAIAPQAWEPDQCPLCAAGEALDSPGSRHGQDAPRLPGGRDR